MSIFSSLLRERSRLKGFKSTVESGNTPDGTDPLVVAWLAAVSGAGGTLEVDSRSICEGLVAQLRGFSGLAKLKYLLPLLGSNLAAARVPIIDTLSAGIASNTNFVDGDFSQATGLQGASGKYLNTHVKPANLNTGLVGGLGFWENNSAGFSNDSVAIGTYSGTNNPRWMLDMRAATQRFIWSDFTRKALNTAAYSNGHYYGQSNSGSDRKLYLNATQVGSETSVDSSTPESTNTITIMNSAAFPTADYHNGRCALAYMTDGTLSTGEISALHTLLSTYLITATGR